MHPVLGIHVASICAAGVLASAIPARQRDPLVSRLSSLLLLSAGVWSLFDLLVSTAPDAELAARWLRTATLASFPVGALLLHLAVHTLRSRLDRVRPLVGLGYAAAGVGIAVSLGTDMGVAGASPSGWGWLLVPGPGYLPVVALVSAAPALAAVEYLRAPAGRHGSRGFTGSSIERAGFLCFAAAALTDVMLPAVGVAFPRLGSASLVTWSGVIWWARYRSRDPRSAPQRFAREILETLPDAVALARTDGRIRSANGRLAALCERAPAELLGASIYDLLPDLEPELEPDLEPDRDDPEAESECELHSTGGRRVPVSVYRKSLNDTDGRPIGRVFVLRDLSEVVSLRTQLASAGRLAAVGQLAAGIAHEINNPIAYVGANLRLLRRDWAALDQSLAKPAGPGVQSALEEGPELLDECCEGVDRVAAIVRDVGGFSSSGGPERVSADLTELIDAAARVAGPQLAGARIERHYDARPRVPCVKRELMQVFLNLLVNAGQALDAGGTIRLATRIEGGKAVVEVADDGPGIPARLLERIFDPFFTTKPVGEGTGLGLSISRQILAQHGGRIEVDSSPERGTTFVIRLPADPAAALEAR